MLLHAESAARPRPPRIQRRADDEFVLGPHPLDTRGVAALQRSAGNRAVAGMLAPTVQRCGPGGCADCGPAKEDETPLAAHQGMDGVVEEPPLIAAQSRPVQRVATWANGTVHETRNLAEPGPR